MLIKTQDIPPQGLVVEFSLTQGDLAKANKEFQVNLMQCRARLMRMEDQISLEGQYNTSVELQCDMCLCPVEKTMENQFRLELFPVGHDAQWPKDMEIPLDTPETDVYENSILQLNAYFEDQLILDLPIQNLCKPDCKGLCPQCGSDLNHSTCDCNLAGTSNPFALFNRQTKNTSKE